MHLALALFLMPRATASAPLTLSGGAIGKTVSCEPGQDVHLETASADIRIEGSCGDLKIDGASNTVRIDGVASIAIDGAMNKVYWTRNLSGQKELPVKTSGAMNEVTHLAPPPEAEEAKAALVITGVGNARQQSCQPGQPVRIEGAQIVVEVSGDCGPLTIEGAQNEVSIDGVSAITVDGSMNKVRWKRNLSGAKKLPTSLTGAMNDVKQD